MKSRKKHCLKIFLLIALIFLVGSEQTSVYAGTQTIDIKNYLKNDYKNQHIIGCSKLSSAIGGMNPKKNAAYRNFYKVGKKMYIGANNTKNAAYPRKLVYIKNNGNKKIRYYGVKIGDSYSIVKQSLAKYHMTGVRVKNDVYVFSNSNASSLRAVFRSGKLRSFIYIYSYTS